MSRTFARRALGVTSRGAQATRRYIPPIPVDPPSEILDRTLMRLEREVDPPTGHVALVFTDIKGSTRLWETRPAAMQAAIKQHNALFRRLLRTVGRGYEVKTEGDAFMVAFPTVFHAAQWCLTVQEQLMLVDWPRELLEAPEAAEVKVPRAVVEEDEDEEAAAGTLPPHGSAGNLGYYSEDSLAPQTQGGAADGDDVVIFRGIRVRMGIHCGQPSCERDPITGRMDYFGRMVNRSARISSSADGGEITISADVLNELEDAASTHVTHFGPLQNVVASLHMQELAHHHQPLLQSLIGLVHTNPHYVAQALELVSLRWSQAPAPASAMWVRLPPPLMPPRPDQ
ncbi:hypothetical protein AMAG_17655 [Allomyces macrogynus ATCC 38327]|uniref:Guanylate cyclase domain-containing protein n=1 Tax=Allomyces macrogynus (strain ATCC 38327) TaxID=578462 RepID=A0A0L0RV45_ALLM3|nr:hypothetical protein AMAG_17655 [Allomyces macrogynus ATCC 38327]|eukprot:KNE54322.1 hypothetical protein AMAG_17655 [Allomyces macrogynus ATCC 38327]